MTEYEDGDIIAWGTELYEHRGIVITISLDKQTLFVHEIYPTSKHYVRVQSDKVLRVEKSTVQR